MTKGIKQVMAIARPAVISLYGRQPLKLFSYKVGLIYANTTRCYSLVINGKSGNRFFVELIENKEKIPEVTQVLKYEDDHQQTAIDKLVAYIRGEIPLSEIEELLEAQAGKRE